MPFPELQLCQGVRQLREGKGMTTYRLFRIRLRTRAGLTLYARLPDRDGDPITWTREPDKADRMMSASALDAICRLRRERKPARLERCDETI